MSRIRRIALLAILTGPLLGAASAKRPSVTELRIDKSERRLEVVAGDVVLKTYDVALGPGGSGPKRYEGDKVTPIGTYRVIAKIPRLFHQFLSLDYPNAEDRARYAKLKAAGDIPKGIGIGFGIGIHGVGNPELEPTHKESDWTFGCIALDDAEIDELVKLAPVGTRVVITD
jgi:murein L,D-transpeptidase YafK